MNRKDYRKIMEYKKRNKMYAKATIVGALGLTFFGITTQANAEEWKANSVEQIKESVKDAKDGVYTIKSGDTLSGISEATGITIETLAKVNNISNVDLIYAGDKLIIQTEDGKVALVDENNTVKNEVSLTKEDKEGIKEVQKEDTNQVYSNNTSSSNTATTEGQSTNNGNKPSRPNTDGSTNENTGGTINTVNPTSPVNPVEPTNPVEKEFTVIINHVSEDGDVLSKETRQVKEGTTFEAKALDFSDRGYELIGEDKQTVHVKDNTVITFTYKKVDNTKPVENKVDVTIKHVANDGKVLSTEIVSAEKDSMVKADAKDFTTEGYVLDDSLVKEIKAEVGATITFNYRKIDVTNPIEKVTITTKYIDENGQSIAKDKIQEVEKGSVIIETALNIDGYKIKGNNTQSVVANSNQLITFTYEKEAGYVPVHTTETVVENVDTDGNVLSSTV